MDGSFEDTFTLRATGTPIRVLPTGKLVEALAATERGVHVSSILTKRTVMGTASLLFPDTTTVTLKERKVVFNQVRTLIFAMRRGLVLPVLTVLEIVTKVFFPDTLGTISAGIEPNFLVTMLMSRSLSGKNFTSSQELVPVVRALDSAVTRCGTNVLKAGT